MTPRGSRRKGAKIEREIVDAHVAIGIPAKRVPLSGAAEGWKGDVRIAHVTGELMAEVKARASGAGFAVLERWLGGMDLIFLRRDRREPMVAMSWRTYARLIGGNHEDARDPDPALG